MSRLSQPGPAPPQPLRSLSREEPGNAPLVVFGNVPFASVWQRSQQLAICLAEKMDVVYVDPNRSFLQVLRRGRHEHDVAADRLPPRLFRYRPAAGFPCARSVPALNCLNYRRTLKGLWQFLGKQGLGRPGAIVLSFPDQFPVTADFADARLVYDVMDEPALFLTPHQFRHFDRLHRLVLERAHLVVTSSRTLLDRYRPQTRHATCITNGVSRHLAHGLLSAAPHPVLGRLPGPRFGYVGMISHWFDFDAIRALAQSFPGGSVILVGPVDREVPRLPSNVVFVGPIPHLELAPVLRTFDVGLIPFRRSRAIDAVNPVKVYEYLAAGLPILASRFEEIADFGDLVATYEGERECVATARALLSGGRLAPDAQARRAYALRNCWSAKADQFLDALRHACGAPTLSQHV